MTMIISSLSWQWQQEFTCTRCATHLDKVHVYYRMLFNNINSAVSVQHQICALGCVQIKLSPLGYLQPNPSLLAAFYDYIKLMPMVTEANQMSQELNKVRNIINSELIISPSALSNHVSPSTLLH